MDGPRDYHIKWSKSKANIIWYCLNVESENKKGTNELTYKTEIEYRYRKKRMVTRGKKRRNKLGDQEWHIHTTMYKIANSKDLLYRIQNSTQYSVMAYMEKIMERVDVCICTTYLLCHTSETNITLYINYTPINFFFKEHPFFFERNLRSSLSGQPNRRHVTQRSNSKWVQRHEHSFNKYTFIWPIFIDCLCFARQCDKCLQPRLSGAQIFNSPYYQSQNQPTLYGIVQFSWHQQVHSIYSFWSKMKGRWRWGKKKMQRRLTVVWSKFPLYSPLIWVFWRIFSCTFSCVQLLRDLTPSINFEQNNINSWFEYAFIIIITIIGPICTVLVVVITWW